MPQFVLDLGRRKVVTSTHGTLRGDHLRSGIDDPTPVAVMLVHPQDPARWALRNASTQTWTARYPDGGAFRVEGGGNVELEPGLQLQLGSTELTVRKPQEEPCTGSS